MSEEIGPIKKNELQLTRLPRLSGPRYLTYGLSLMCFKYIIDTVFSNVVFHRAWNLSEYFVPHALTNPTLLTGTGTGAFYGSMLLVALPFAFIGSMLTLRRLKAMGLPPWLVILFYIPFLNMIFFIILVVVEAAPSGGNNQLLPTPDGVADNHGKALTLGGWSASAGTGPGFVPRSATVTVPGTASSKAVALMDKLPAKGWEALFVAAALPVPVAVLAALFSVGMLGTYGWTIFTAIPFIASVAAPILYGWRQRRTFVECLLVSVTCLMIMASSLLAIPFEGIICVLMAAPLAVGIGIVGGAVGFVIQDNLPRSESMPKLLGCFAIALPLLMIGEYITPLTVPMYKNTSCIEINAPPEVVWKYLIDFPPMGPPSDWVFKTGIAYPIRAKITGHGPGAIRRCIFTTGQFVEPIEIWDAPKLLKFGVLAQAPPMRELSLYPNLHPAHLDNYLLARQGQFELVPSGSGHTRIEGTTWYQNYMGPSPYWRLWSDWIIHRIHVRVLDHVKTLAEHEVQTRTVPAVRQLPTVSITPGIR